MSIAETRRKRMFPCLRDARTPGRANRAVMPEAVAALEAGIARWTPLGRLGDADEKTLCFFLGAVIRTE
jgi:hypothetical protein